MTQAATIKEKPILFSAAMIRALLAGRKTQTRRLVKHQDELQFIAAGGDDKADPRNWGWLTDAGDYCHLVDAGHGESYLKPRIRVGDVLWVREALFCDIDKGWCYAADDAPLEWKAADEDEGISWLETRPARKSAYPSIHMPRWACRIRPEVLSVRVERVQSISEADCAAEGMTTGLCEQVLNEAAGKKQPQDSYYVRGDTEDFTVGHQCLACAKRTQKKNATKGAHIVAEGCPESDGPAYCDDCHTPLVISLTEYGIERELFLEPDDGSFVDRFAATGMDAAIAGMIAGGIGDLREHHKPRLNKIGFATLWDAINGAGSWESNPWVWVYTFRPLTGGKA